MDLRTGPGIAALTCLPGIGPSRAVTLAATYDTWSALAAAHRDDLAALIGARAAAAVTAAMTPTAPTPPPTTARPLSVYDADYPALLHTLHNPPPLLWCIGTAPPPDPAIAVVGTRKPTPGGAAITTLIAAEAATRHIAVISGLAEGVDSLAAQAAAEHGQPSWAYLGQGLDTIPTGTPRHRLAAQIIADGGGLLAEVPPHIPPDTPHRARLLVARNRLQSGTAAVTVIAQSAVPSNAVKAGTMHTARFAIEQQRILAVAAPPPNERDHPAFSGNLALLNPDGCDPAAVHTDTAATRALIASRHPAADLRIASRADLDALWAAAQNYQPPTPAPQPRTSQASLF